MIEQKQPCNGRCFCACSEEYRQVMQHEDSRKQEPKQQPRSDYWNRMILPDDFLDPDRK
jgi:hypothetical protein